MGKKAKTGKNRKDRFYQLAKEQGYRSRASFKLVQLNKRYDFLSRAGRGVLDLCAAPGGWLQVARKYIPMTAPCIGVDLVPIKGIPNVISLAEDITKEACRTAIKRELKEHPGAFADGKVDAVLNDGSPNMGAAWLQDAYTQADLTLSALKLATEFLTRGGTFVSKVFRSNDYNALLYIMNQFFTNVRATKPTASRAESAEIYVVCTGFKAPKKVDPRLLDPKTVFQTLKEDKSAERAKLPDNAKKRRHREGYEDGVSTLFKKCSVVEFVRTEDPLQFLNDYNEFDFPKDDEDIQFLTELEETDDEVRAACADLKVLSKKDFRSLLRWRGRARNQLLNRDQSLKKKERESSAVGEGKSNASADGKEQESADEDERLQAEIEERRLKIQAREKRDKKRKAKLRTKAQQRIDLKMDIPGDQLGAEDNETAFNFSSVNASGNEELAEADVPDLDPEMNANINEDGDELFIEDEEGKARAGTYEEELEEQLDFLYSKYEERRKGRSKSKKKPKDTSEMTETNGFEEVKASNPADSGDSSSDSDSLSESDSDEEGVETMLEGVKGSNHNEQASIWFNQPLMKQILEPVSEVEDLDENPLTNKSKRRRLNVDKTVSAYSAPDPDEAGQNEDDDMAQEDDDKDQGDEGTFDLSGYDEQERAEIVASAAKLKLMKKRDRHALVDDTYNRYAFDDPLALPKWFADEDERNRERIIPPTKAEIDEMKARLRILEGRPTKKEREAKGRKKMREDRRMEKLKQKMNSIADDGDSNTAAKLKAIEALIRKGSKKNKEAGKKYVVATRRGEKKVVGGDRSKGARVKLVDKRMKADRRGLQKAARKGKKAGK